MTSTNAADASGGEGDTPGEAALLVSEFPPPPYYYTEAANLPPPEIPIDALQRGTRRAAASAARARAEAERLRLADESDKTADVLGGGVLAGGQPSDEEEEGDVVGVFGEIVEDPLMVQPLDVCEDPTVIRDEVKRLNRQVLHGFVTLVQDLVNRPAQNKKARDELSHNIFLMLQETNKFREHQSRELLIEILERELHERERLVRDLERKVAQADLLLNNDNGVDSTGATPMDES